MSCHSSAAMKLFIVKLLFAIIVITDLSVPEVSGQTNLTDNTTPVPMKYNGGEYKSNCDPLKPSNCTAPLVCQSEHSQCDCDKSSVWSPAKKLCKLKPGSACTKGEDCTDYANCVTQNAHVCLGCGYHHHPVMEVHHPHPRHIYEDHHAVYDHGRSGDDRPKPGPPQCHCTHGPGYTDGTCPSSSTGADKHISPSFMLFTGTLLLVSRKAMYSFHS